MRRAVLDAGSAGLNATSRGPGRAAVAESPGSRGEENGVLARERQRVILERIETLGSARVRELASALHVAEETIRRDLDALKGRGRLIRIHGGAISLEDHRREMPMAMRRVANLDEKRVIARLVASQIEENSVIALDASSTALELARVIPDLSLTVVTNSLEVLTLLANRSRIVTISTGGIFHPPSLSLLGNTAEESLGRYNIHKLFFSSKGVDLERGLSVANHEHARIKRRMLELAEQVILLADSTKFGVRSVEFFASLDEIDVIVTDRRWDDYMAADHRAPLICTGSAS